jgi:hypothetical protein
MPIFNQPLRGVSLLDKRTAKTRRSTSCNGNASDLVYPKVKPGYRTVSFQMAAPSVNRVSPLLHTGAMTKDNCELEGLILQPSY